MGSFRFFNIHLGVPALHLVVVWMAWPQTHQDTTGQPGPTPYPALVDVVHQSLHGTLQHSSCHCLIGADDVLFTFLFTQKVYLYTRKFKKVKRSLISFDDFNAKHTPCATFISFNMILNVYTCTLDIQCILRK